MAATTPSGSHRDPDSPATTPGARKAGRLAGSGAGTTGRHRFKPARQRYGFCGPWPRFAQLHEPAAARAALAEYMASPVAASNNTILNACASASSSLAETQDWTAAKSSSGILLLAVGKIRGWPETGRPCSIRPWRWRWQRIRALRRGGKRRSQPRPATAIPACVPAPRSRRCKASRNAPTGGLPALPPSARRGLCASRMGPGRVLATLTSGQDHRRWSQPDRPTLR